MKVIYKYRVNILDEQTINLFEGAEILHFGIQDREALIWVKVDTDNSLEPRHFELHGTGNTIESDNLKYIGTIVLTTYVWHLFEKLS